jgi:hypothetical protein
MKAQHKKALKKWMSVPTLLLFGWGPLYVLDWLQHITGNETDSWYVNVAVDWSLSVTILSTYLAAVLVIIFAIVDLTRRRTLI